MYDLHKLGWHSFQQLCHTIGGKVLGQTLESLADSNDGGRDGAFKGTWNPDGREDLEGSFVIQCKFTAKADGHLTPSGLAEEVEKAKALVQQGICDSYILMTNASITGTSNRKIRKMLEDVGVKHVRIFGASWLTRQIVENKRLRMLVPRVYGLGDLSEILDERAYAQAQAVLETMREDIAKVVITEAYNRAAEALNQNGFVLLIGEPAAGKTTIASLLAMVAVDNWDARTLVLDDPGQLIEHWNPHEPSQFFWIDDAFGVTQYEEALVYGWNRVLPRIQVMLDKGAKIVLTSRDYIYRRARNTLKDGAFPLLNESQVVIDVHELSSAERQQILYNHLKLGRQPVCFRSAIRPFLEDIAAHERFIPETARRLSDPLFTKSLNFKAYAIDTFVEEREQILRDIIRGLDADNRAALALIFMRQGRFESPIDLEPFEEEALRRLGSNLAGCSSALESMEGSLVQFSNLGDRSYWQFRHPTIGDAYAAILAENRDHLGIFVSGSDPEKLINQVTCGDVGIENATLIPKPLFSVVIDRLGKMTESTRYKSSGLARFEAKRRLLHFLASRCSVDFLQLYLQQHPELLDEVAQPGLMLDAVPEVPVAQRLHHLGILPDEYRQRFVETVISYAVDGDDGSALTDGSIKGFFTREEWLQFMTQVRTDLLPNLDRVRDNWEWNWDSDVAPDDWMYPLQHLLDGLSIEFNDDEDVVNLIDDQKSRIDSWIVNHHEDDDEREERLIGRVDIPIIQQGVRSIFDDIDAE